MTIKTSLDPILSTGKTYLIYSWSGLTNKISSLTKAVFSTIYAIYDFPRSTNPITQRREFRWLPTSAEKAIGEASYYALLRKSGRLVKETDITFGNYSKLVHEVGKKLIGKCPRKDLPFEMVKSQII